MLFAVFLISLLAAVGLGIYSYGALVGVRSQKLDSFQVPPPLPQQPYVSLPYPPEPPVRAARGTTPPPLPLDRAPSPVPGVVSSREDSTEPDANARFSVKRASQRRL